MRKTSFITLVITALSTLAGGQDNVNSNLPENDMLRIFGAARYEKAPPLLETYFSEHPEEAPQLYYYIGECHFQTERLQQAKSSFQEALATPFNQEEACGRLLQIALEEKDNAKVEEYQRLLKSISERMTNVRIEPVQLSSHPGRVTHEEIGEWLRVFGADNNPCTGGGNILMSKGRFDDAIKVYLRDLNKHVELKDRFSSRDALILYRRLSEAYTQKAALLKRAGAEEKAITEATTFARFYSRKAIVVESRLTVQEIK